MEFAHGLKAQYYVQTHTGGIGEGNPGLKALVKPSGNWGQPKELGGHKALLPCWRWAAILDIITSTITS